MAQLNDCTFLIKTLLRPDCLARLLLSIHRHYPRTPTIVVDDSGTADCTRVCRPYPWVELIQTPESDVGTSRGRNIGLMRVQTPYFVLLDDDFVFWPLSDIPFMKQRLEEIDADIVCGPMCNLVNGKIQQSAMEFVAFEGGHLMIQSQLPRGSEGWVHASNNFFLARTSIRDKFQWPDPLKNHEHAPFFWLAYKNGARVWISPRSSTGHLHTTNPAYDALRFRCRTKAGQTVRQACRMFSRDQRLVWLRNQAHESVSQILDGRPFRWNRPLTPWCKTQTMFLQLTQELATTPVCAGQLGRGR